ncbi:M57 family metalloprotease [Niabella beijingensis]|uniref:M57 family metalloprotease n=1 Tax=Niabella beijingensis TaxID=2872700 RepID=UPI001CBCEAC0|nr:M57 family metalloprotease [Niabella beijingensis]MBZ4189495.1 zinc-dependent metalloprotease [Niabella beijingensis]
MKKLKQLAVLIIFTAFIGCKKNDFSEIKKDDKNELSAVLQNFLKSNSLSSKDVQENDDYFIVDGDILISKSGLKKIAATSPRQVSTNNTVQGSLTNITIGFYDATPSQFSADDSRWFYTIRRAVDAWNTISSCRINLIHVYNNMYAPYPSLNVDILVVPENLGSGNFGQGEWPTQAGAPGNRIKVNPYTANTDGSPRSQDQDVYMLIHEIGHCLGLRHTDWFVEGAGTIGANPIPGTPSSGASTDDASSVMNSGRLGTSYGWGAYPSDGRFSSYDKVAARYLYPLGNSGYTFKTVINGPTSGSVSQTLIMTSGAGADNYGHEWRELDASGNILYGPYQAGAQIEFSMPNPGTYFLETRIINGELPGEWIRKTVVFN